jgi:hypothetical protein
MAYDWRTEWPNVFARHDDSCPVRAGHRCTCGPLAYRASARDPTTRRRVLSPDFPTVAEARTWLAEQHDTIEAAKGVRTGDARLGAVIDDFAAAAASGLARDAGGVPYAPARVHALRELLGYVDGQLGSMDIKDVRRRHVQGLVDQLRLAGSDVDHIKAVVGALRSLYVYAIQRDVVDFSPVVALALRGDGEPPAPAQPTPAPLPASMPPAATTAAPALPAFATTGVSPAADPYYQALTPERVLWWTLLIIVVVSVLIAIVLAAESV